jgi:hypothetical protein
MNLYKVTVKSSSVFTFNNIKGGIYYVVARSKEEAVKYIKEHVRDGYVVNKVSLLGEQYSGRLFGKVVK